MGYETIVAAPLSHVEFSPSSAEEFCISAGFDGATHPSLSHVRGKHLFPWKKSINQSDRSWKEFDGGMRTLAKQVVLSGYPSGIYAGKIQNPEVAYNWITARLPSSTDPETRFAYRDWVARQFAPHSRIPNPYQIDHEMLESRDFNDGDVLKERMGELVERALHELAYMSHDIDGLETTFAYSISDGFLLNITTEEFFNLMSDLMQDDGDGELEQLRGMLTQWRQIHEEDALRDEHAPAAVLKKTANQLVKKADKVVDGLVDRPKESGRVSAYIKKKKDAMLGFKNFQKASYAAKELADMVVIEGEEQEQVQNVLEESVWEQIGTHYGLSSSVINVLRRHPEARSAIRNSVRMAPLYLGQRTLVGWPAWAGLVAVFESTPVLHDIIHSDKANLAVAGAGLITYMGARMKSIMHSHAMRDRIGSPDLIATLGQINSIATNPNEPFSIHGKRGAQKARAADLLWIGWPFALYGAYKIGHASEYLLSGNVNFAIEAAIINATRKFKKK